MRVAPVGLLFHHAPDLYERAAASAAVTHAHPLGQDGASVQALAVAQALKLDPEEPFPRDTFLKDLRARTRTAELQEKLDLLGDLLSHGASAAEAARSLGRSVAVHESLPFALFAFLSHPDSYRDCLWCAVLNGGDRDTLGAMAGAVSGAYLGVAAIPPEWQKKLENRTLIEQAAMALLRRTAS